MNSSSAWLPSSSSSSSAAAAADNKMEEGKRRKSRTKPKPKLRPKLRGINSDTDADDHSDECTTSGDWLPKTLIIENKIIPSNANTNNNTNSDGGCGGSWIPGCLSNRKVICGIIFYAVVATVLWSFFFSRSFSLFNRQSQIEELTAQVQILDGEIDELEIQVDRLGGEVSTLKYLFTLKLVYLIDGNKYMNCR